MRRLALVAALAGTALASPSLARDNAWYVGLDAGGTIVEDIDVDVIIPSGARAENAIELGNEVGFDVGGLVGYDFGVFRSEFEVSYREAQIDDAQLTGEATIVGGGGDSGVVGPVSTGIFPDGDGATQVISFMVNGLFDFGIGDDSPWSASVG
ncbi:MAG: flagellar motor protein MotB, partial [Pseudomonadota bacterium]